MKTSLLIFILSALALAGCSSATTPGVDPIGQWNDYKIDPQTDPETVAGCKALDIGKEVYALMGQTTLIPRPNKANNLMCAFVIEGTEMSDSELKEAGMTPGGDRAFPDALLITVDYKGASGFHSLYPEIRPDGEPWGQSDLGDEAKWWSKDPQKHGEYGNGLGIVSGNTFIQISTIFPEESPILDQPQARYEDLGQKILDGPYAEVDPRL